MRREHTFKVGDRVVSIGSCGAWTTYCIRGKYLPDYHGTVIHISSVAHPPILVEFDEDIDGHNGNGYAKGRDGHCYFCYPSELTYECDRTPQKLEISFDEIIN